MTGPEAAAKEDATFPRTIIVDFAIMSSRVSRSRVALWSGDMQKVSTNANMKWRFTRHLKASSRPIEVVNNKGVAGDMRASPVFLGHSLGAPCPKNQDFPGRTINIGRFRSCRTGLIVLPKIRSLR